MTIAIVTAWFWIKEMIIITYLQKVIEIELKL